MKNEVASGTYTQVQETQENLSYEISRRPNNRHKKLYTTIGTTFTTPSGARVPPSWTNIWMTTDPKSPIQAIGQDSKGRRVYLYSTEHMGMATAAKFSRLKTFSKAYLSLIKKIRHDMKSSEDALVLYLTARCSGYKSTYKLPFYLPVTVPPL
jgi:DNA topoisomerase IB